MRRSAVTFAPDSEAIGALLVMAFHAAAAELSSVPFLCAYALGFHAKTRRRKEKDSSFSACKRTEESAQFFIHLLRMSQRVGYLEAQ